MEVFRDAGDGRESERFLRWLDLNPEGLYVNCRTANDMMLHRSSCSGVSFREPRNLAKQAKVCSLDRRELEQWAATHSDKLLKNCKRCSPGT